jgi:p-cumate 2,3-dioxygenase alpha subunit
MGTMRAPRTSGIFEFLVETGWTPVLCAAAAAGVGKALGNGHAVIQSEPGVRRPIARWTPSFGEKRAELEAIYDKMVERFGAEWAYQMTQTSRNLLIFPNLIINDIMAITVRTFSAGTGLHRNQRLGLAPKMKSARTAPCAWTTS